MFQRLNLLIRFLGLYVSRRQGMALLERVQASSLSDHDRDRVSHILRAMLRLPDDPVHEPSAPEAPVPARPTLPRKATRQRQPATASRWQKRPAS